MGAPFDSFTFRELEDDGNNLIFCGQQKLYSREQLTNADIQIEAEKVDAWLQNVPHILVIFASEVAADVSLCNIPANCCVVTGQAWNKFYSSLFIGRARLMYDATRTMVNINTATKYELMTFDRIGPTFADRIVNSRKDQPFQNWDDVINRIANTPNKNAGYINY